MFHEDERRERGIASAKPLGRYWQKEAETRNPREEADSNKPTARNTQLETDGTNTVRTKPTARNRQQETDSTEPRARNRKNNDDSKKSTARNRQHEADRKKKLQKTDSKKLTAPTRQHKFDSTKPTARNRQHQFDGPGRQSRRACWPVAPANTSTDPPAHVQDPLFRQTSPHRVSTKQAHNYTTAVTRGVGVPSECRMKQEQLPTYAVEGPTLCPPCYFLRASQDIFILLLQLPPCPAQGKHTK